MERVNFYAGLALDRMTERRSDSAWIESLFRNPNSRLIPVWRSRSLIREGATPEAVFLSTSDLAVQNDTAMFLGLLGDAAYFATDISHVEEPALPDVVGGRGKFVDLRAVGAVMDRQHGGPLAYARGPAHWPLRHRFCGVCGAAAVSAPGGHLRPCTHPAPAPQPFPHPHTAV